MSLLAFLGPWLYWPLVVMLTGFAAAATVSNVSMVYSELWHQIKELKRVTK